MEQEEKAISEVVTPVDTVTEIVEEKPKKNKVFLITVSILLLLICLAGGYYVYTQYFAKEKEVIEEIVDVVEEDAIDNELTVEEDISEELTEIPDGWVKRESANCGVQFTIPSQEYEIDNDMYSWELRDNVSSSLMLSMSTNWSNNLEKAEALFISESNLGSGYTPYLVGVRCTGNEDSLENNEYLDAIEGYLEEYNNATYDKGMRADQYSIENSLIVQRWGLEVLDLDINVMNSTQEVVDTIQLTVFATPEYLFEVEIYHDMENESVATDANKIFEYLEFN